MICPSCSLDVEPVGVLRRQPRPSARCRTAETVADDVLEQLVHVDQQARPADVTLRVLLEGA